MSLFLKIWWVSLFVKIILGFGVSIFPDETYYWFWSHHLQLSYFDHPPFISWLFWLGHPFEHMGNLARLPVMVMSHLTLLVWQKILVPYLTEKQMVVWLVLAIANPLFGLGGIIATPDIPLIFFWTLSIFFFCELMNTQKLKHAIYLGASFGLGFCSKYNIVLLPLILILWLAINKKWSAIKKSNLLVVFVSGLIFSSPVLIWNYQNNFDSFLFQLKHGLGNNTWSISYPLEYIGGQLALLLPALVYFAYKTFEKTKKDLLVFLGLAPFIFFLFSSLNSRVEANWPIVAYPAILALATISGSESKWTHWTYRIWLGALAIAAPFMLLKIQIPLLRLDKLDEVAELEKIAPNISHYDPLYACNYQTSAYVSYATKKEIFKLRDMSRHDFYDYLPESLPSQNSFYILRKPYMKLPEWAKNLKQEVVENLDPYQILKVTR